ncbi:MULTISPECIES: fasciclin domain-containing protein [Okeania]|uniref:Fasciclin domain-containing protein n=1 Tax=Okeania hirsuta TaxID=1458930 RepID=A0A3N6P5V2_9CYAN|nr:MULTISPECIES: fasciclin domain-containing protein [Okeania]NET12170.1 fasciclin domain-containing protein [Okeania sp. SIO1H6]NES76820.1 fasciclin domain-containing protein [Okeania sp. SIO1H4]NES92704.1 fasciclin domain-containing protein [Okeania sp. SIO2B9]NET20448.1 fasciclin domain-containing protein [Okeania sp. SIO1H5]NET77139.1 fasciclin domain-containing protein [Okeania sp. SIO1F9]
MNNQNSFNIVERAIAILGLVGTTAFFGLPAVANFSQKSSTQSVVNQPLQIADSNSKDIVATAAEAGQFNTLAAALKAAGLVEVLQGEGPFTVFAPTDKAFAALPAGTVEKLLLPENKDKLVKILTYHVVPGKVMSGDLESGMVKTVEGSKVNIDVSNSGVKVGKANVVKADVPASNGVIHVIDTVIVPE